MFKAASDPLRYAKALGQVFAQLCGQVKSSPASAPEAAINTPSAVHARLRLARLTLTNLVSVRRKRVTTKKSYLSRVCHGPWGGRRSHELRVVLAKYAHRARHSCHSRE